MARHSFPNMNPLRLILLIAVRPDLFCGTLIYLLRRPGGRFALRCVVKETLRNMGMGRIELAGGPLDGQALRWPRGRHWVRLALRRRNGQWQRCRDRAAERIDYYERVTLGRARHMLDVPFTKTT